MIKKTTQFVAGLAKFIGDKEIKSIEGTLVTFTDDTQKTYTEKQLAYLVTDESKDLSEMQEIIVTNVAPEVAQALQNGDLEEENAIILSILEILEAHDIKLGESAKILGTVMAKFDIILKGVVSSIDEEYNNALGKAFGTYVEGRPSTQFRDNIRMSDIIRVKT